MNGILKEIRTGLMCTLVLGVLVCGAYPLAVWGIAQGAFAWKANGSLVEREGVVIGSRFVAQGFTGPRYFSPRPSLAGAGYDASSSGGSNLGPLSMKLVDAVRKRAVVYRHENGLQAGTLIPADAATASASGLDPHISPENALLQAPRVARVRAMSEEAVRRLIAGRTEGRDLGFLGEPRVNVLMLNLDLDKGR